MTTLASPPPATPRAHRPPPSVRLLRAVGWTLVAAGVVVLLYIVYALWFTGFETQQAQQQLRQQWQQQVGASTGEDAQPPGGAETAAPPAGGEADTEAVPTGEDGDAGQDEDRDAGQTRDASRDGLAGDAALAKMEFVRPGSAATPVRSDPLFVVNGVGYNDLTRGPGRYPDTALPGEDGNFAIAGHRTTYDAPFYDLDELRQGDEIHITDRSGTEHVYAFAERRIVEPTAAWVLADEPLDGATATLTLTTCHPRFSAAQRMVVFAELVSR